MTLTTPKFIGTPLVTAHYRGRELGQQYSKDQMLRGEAVEGSHGTRGEARLAARSTIAEQSPIANARAIAQLPHGGYHAIRLDAPTTATISGAVLHRGSHIGNVTKEIQPASASTVPSNKLAGARIVDFIDTGGSVHSFKMTAGGKAAAIGGASLLATAVIGGGLVAVGKIDV